MPVTRLRSIAAGMPSLSTRSVRVPALPAVSDARTSKRSTPPGATGSATGTVASHVPACAVPTVRVASTPFTVTAAIPTVSFAWTTTAKVEPDNSASAEDVICTSGAIVSLTMTLNPALAILPVASVAEQVTAVDPIAKTLPDAGAHVMGAAPLTTSVALAV